MRKRILESKIEFICNECRSTQYDIIGEDDKKYECECGQRLKIYMVDKPEAANENNKKSNN